jgi:hypothetical protein
MLRLGACWISFMPTPASDRLIERAKLAGAGSFGISAADIARIPLTEEVIDEISECLSSRDPSEVKWGLYFAAGILDSNPPEQFLRWLMSKVPDWIKHENWDIRDEALAVTNFFDVVLFPKLAS